MKTLNLLLVLISSLLYGCAQKASTDNNDQNKESTSESILFTSDYHYDLKSTNELKDYLFKVVSYDEEGATFRILYKEDQSNFIEYILNHRGNDENYYSQPTAKEILDSIKSVCNKKPFILEVTEAAEALGTIYNIYREPPKTGKEYVDGIEWIDASPGYFSKLFKKKNTMWSNWYDIYYSFSPKLADWEIEIIKNYNIDSLGLSIHHVLPENPEMADASMYDTTYYSRLFPNRKIPYKSSWNPSSFFYPGNMSQENLSGSYNIGTVLLRDFVYQQNKQMFSYDEFQDSFVFFLLDADCKPEEEWLMDSSECKNALLASPFSVSFSSEELKQIDATYGSHYWETREKIIQKKIQRTAQPWR